MEKSQIHILTIVGQAPTKFQCSCGAQFVGYLDAHEHLEKSQNARLDLTPKRKKSKRRMKQPTKQELKNKLKEKSNQLEELREKVKQIRANSTRSRFGNYWLGSMQWNAGFNK